MIKQTFTLREVLQLCGWTRNQYYRKRDRGRLPFLPLASSDREKLSFNRADVERYLGHPVDHDVLETDDGYVEIKPE